MILKTISIKWRKPENKKERHCYGHTMTIGSNAEIFINAKRCKGVREEVITFWHEMAHVFCHFHKHKLSKEQEEQLCERIGKVVWELL
jgi:hypothetical protein